ncbi:hypothetical protein CUM95_12335 [Enterococcus faecium]|uniref:hypothetical protein n=1 Tax=Enterococcus faecium TaxID=1352 RepID=UPI000CF0BF01|nr:hypothetical protein [Enterococcus faecium]PQB70125.1 hypothetical protein CUN32_00340 [Enterococcus faecium]PQC37298.1 hypothetical protein CUM95_12335 [Enterococcus faecium]PWO39972.1 hypothetical protein DKT67_00110 [Enterococcus faecium]
MARPVLEAMDMDTLTKGRYVQLLARGYSPKEVFKALSKGTDMEKEMGILGLGNKNESKIKSKV